MIDEKEEFINTISMKMNLDREEDQKLRNLLWMGLNRFSLIEIKETDIQVRNETLNEEALRMFFVAKSVQGCTKRTLQYYRLMLRQFFTFMGDKPIDQITTNDIRYFLAIKKERDGNKDTNINNFRRVLSSFLDGATKKNI